MSQCAYLPYGDSNPPNIAACSLATCGSGAGTAFGYDGYRYAPETGLYHTGARYYDPRLARFLQSDPIGQAGGLSLYAYVRNDPLNRTDPLGLCDNPQGCGGGSSNQLIPSPTNVGSGRPTQTAPATSDSTTTTMPEPSQLVSQNLFPPSAQPSDIGATQATVGLPAQNSTAAVGIQVAAGGFECQGLGSSGCQSGGSYGTTGMYQGGGAHSVPAVHH